MRPLTPNSGPNFWDGRYLGSVVESVLRSRCRTSKELARTLSPCDPCPGKGCGQGLREPGLLEVLSEPACRGDDRSTFRSRPERTPPGRTGPCRRVFEKANSLNDPTNQEAINKLSDTPIHRA